MSRPVRKLVENRLVGTGTGDVLLEEGPIAVGLPDGWRAVCNRPRIRPVVAQQLRDPFVRLDDIARRRIRDDDRVRDRLENRLVLRTERLSVANVSNDDHVLASTAALDRAQTDIDRDLRSRPSVGQIDRDPRPSVGFQGSAMYASRLATCSARTDSGTRISIGSPTSSDGS